MPRTVKSRSTAEQPARPSDVKPSNWGYKQLSNDEQAEILSLSDAGHNYAQIARKLRRDESTIRRYLYKVRDTTQIARAYFKAQALPMAEKVVAEADVDQMIDVLSRPNIDVLKPIPREGATGAQIMISVGAESCGAMMAAEMKQVGAGQSEQLGAGQSGQIGQTERQEIEHATGTRRALPSRHEGWEEDPARLQGQGPSR